MGKTINLSGFPPGQTAEQIKEFLENHTGEGSVFALKLRPAKRGGRFYAYIQFQSISQAEKIISLANTTLWYGSSYLKARPADYDIEPNPRTSLHSLQDLVLYFGCQIAKDKLSVLWGTDEVSVDFEFKLRNLQFRLLYHQKLYRLQLSYENIWQITLHRRRGGSAKYLVFQLYGSPRIYQQEVCSSGNDEMNYFRNPDDQWVRTTDFTPGNCIGQSSSLCLVLPSDGELPHFEENFAYYKKRNGQFILEHGSTFSRNRDLVPIVGSPAGIDLPYDILFKLNSLIQWGVLSGPTLDKTFYRLVDPRRMKRPFIEFALDKLSSLKESCYEPAAWLNEEYQKYMTSKKPRKPAPISLDSGLVYVRRVQITPSKVYFSGPEVNVSNRVLRQYSSDIDNFLRVSFVDEEMENLYSTDLSPRTSTRKTRIYNRILSVLRDGIVIGNKKFEFLAFSSSQLRENSLWMFASTDEDSAKTIRAGMGDFRQIRNVAKYAARLGQSFGSSTETRSVRRHEMEVIPDVTVKFCGVKYVFSDGIGKISADFAKRVAKKCGYKAFTPSAFQIRYGGYKGVVAVDPTSSMKLSLRKSMSKFESENRKLDVLACSKFQPCFLNRQLITLLSTLEVQDHVFLKKQRAAVQHLDNILTDPLKAEEALDLMSAGESTNVLKELLMCGYKPNVEPFLSMMLQTFRASKLLDLRTKARIFIPDGRAMMGCLDETRTLEYGQVFVQFSGNRRRQLFDDSCMHSGSSVDSCFIIEGKVVVAKNPCLHPGDVRVLEAVNVPELYHMVDCVVFPQKGHRPHPNECSGSDLDGDIYFVCWDPELIPRMQIQPMDYTPAPTIELDRDVTIEKAWFAHPLSYQVDLRSITSLSDWIMAVFISRSRSVSNDASFSTQVAFLLWNIWKQRCSSVFDHSTPCPIRVAKVAFSAASDFLALPRNLQNPKFHFQNPENSALSAWTLPSSTSSIKINTDASWDGPSLSCGLAAVARDSSGRMVGGINTCEVASSALAAEARAIDLGLSLANSLSLSCFTLESDSLSLVSTLQNPLTVIDWTVTNILSQIRRRSSLFRCVNWRWASRLANQAADWVANSTMRKVCPEDWFLNPPSSLLRILLFDAQGPPP